MRSRSHPCGAAPRESRITPMTGITTSDVLARVPLLAGVDKKSLKRLAAELKGRTFTAGTNATEEGGTGIGFFIVLDGTATVTIGGETVNQLGPGDWFGEMAL